MVCADYTKVSLRRLHCCGMLSVDLAFSSRRHSCILCDATSSYSRQLFSVAILSASVDGSIPIEI